MRMIAIHGFPAAVPSFQFQATRGDDFSWLDLPKGGDTTWIIDLTMLLHRLAPFINKSFDIFLILLNPFALMSMTKYKNHCLVENFLIDLFIDKTGIALTHTLPPCKQSSKYD